MPNKNFVILIGGPGLFVDCDPRHDKTWLNYIAPIQMAADNDLYSREVNEKIHWFVFEPPYFNRWLDDSDITTYERIEKFFIDAELHGLRKKAANKVIGKGATSYLNRIMNLAAMKNIAYHGLKRPDDFWKELAKLPDGSISRVWYSGHASDVGLMLSLAHNNRCEAVSTTVINTSDISVKKSLIASKIDYSTTKVSKFYGCATKAFAKKWHQVFNVPTAGATNSITFSVIAKGKNVLNLIENTPTRQGAPVWTIFP